MAFYGRDREFTFSDYDCIDLHKEWFFQENLFTYDQLLARADK